MNNYPIKQLQEYAQQIRRDILSMSFHAKSAHAGGALSVVEILVALYFNAMHVNPKNPEDPSRDRLIFSKAHDAKALYSVLARRGFFDLNVLDGYEQNNGKLPGHSTRHCVPGVEVSAGALGHGLSMAAGVAWALKIGERGKRKGEMRKSYTLHPIPFALPRVFAILSDGECDEGSTWEAALFAGHHRLNNLTVVIDYNKLQGFGFTKDVLTLEPFADKWNAFGFDVKEVHGHRFEEIIPVLSSRHAKPLVVLAHTTKGLGGPLQHIGQISSQYKPPTEEEYNNI